MATTDERLSATFAALADPTRRTILARLLHAKHGWQSGSARLDLSPG